MVANFVTVLITAALLALIVVMVRRRDGAGQGGDHGAGSADAWRGAAPSGPSQPVAEVVPPPREPEAAGRQVMEHLRRLEERTAPGLSAQVLPVFLTDTARRIESLREAVKRRDGAEAHRVAHTLHGSAATVGAAGMVHACAEIIREVRIGAFDGCDRLLNNLDHDFESIRRAAESLRI